MLQQIGIPDKEVQILLRYPFVINALSGKSNPKLFLENLNAFRSDLTKAGITRATIDVLIRNAQVICTAQKSKSQKITRLNLHQRVLAYGALNDDERAIISYSIGKGGEKILQKLLSTNEEFDKLVQKFRRDPKDVLAYLRLNMLSIMADRNLSHSEKLDRLCRYLKDYFELMCILDREAFPSTGNKVYNYVPTYVPDNLSDMGSDPNIGEKMRSGREKIEVTKMDMFTESEDLFFEIFSKGIMNKKEIVMKVAYWVYKHLPYDYKRRGGFLVLFQCHWLDSRVLTQLQSADTMHCSPKY